MSSLHPTTNNKPSEGGKELFVSTWRMHVLEFAKSLSEHFLDREVWLAEGVDESNRKEWMLSCFKCRFAIECAWATVFAIRPVFMHPADIVIGTTKEVRDEFASLVKNTIHTREIMDDVLTPHRLQERKLTDNENYTYLGICERRLKQSNEWFQEYLQRPFRLQETNLEKEVGVVLPYYTHIGQFKPQAYNKRDWTQRLRVAISEELQALLTDSSMKNSQRVDLLAEAARQTIEDWIDAAPNEGLKLAAFVMVVLCITCQARLDRAKELRSRRKKPPEWVVLMLHVMFKDSRHVLENVCNFTNRKFTTLDTINNK